MPPPHQFDIDFCHHSRGSMCLPGAFMATLPSAAAMRRVASTADMLAPLASRGLLAQRAKLDHQHHMLKVDAWTKCVAIECTRRKMLLLMACRNFSPKLLAAHTPEVFAVIQVLEGMASKLMGDVTVHGTHSPKGAHLSNVELRGVSAPANAQHSCTFQLNSASCQTK